LQGEGSRGPKALATSRGEMTGDDLDTGAAEFTVLVNDEEQYSLWPAGRDTPQGWRLVGHEGTAADCAAFVAASWKDLRPASLQRAMKTPPR
jgi:MbtH protein